ncbi:MGDG synthase family glycosyltransferase [Cohnella soli]|uniref:Glycosyltransferase n=1 Tax=Cohnella soli TaxID=425005 RepID=A0ABW0I198_9BACL
MKSNTKIQIVYSSFGDGHLQAALALRQSFASMGIHHVTMIDLFAEAYPRLNAISRYFYLQSTVRFPRLYGQLYRITNRNPKGWHGRLFHSFGKKRLVDSWNGERPDLIIHTFPQLAADELRRQGYHSIPTFTVITDYVLHGRWIHPSTSGYFVATEELMNALIAAGVPEHRVNVTGIPIRQHFSKSYDREVLVKKYGFTAGCRRVLIMAGAYGVQSSVRSMIEITLGDTECETIVVCGKNQNLKNEIEIAYRGEDKVHVLGYVENIHELMALSDCMLTKAGGITLTEALVMRLPTIVYRPLPGQERGNAEYLAGHGAIAIANDIYELSQQLHNVLDPSHAAIMKAAMETVHYANSASLISYEVLACHGLAEEMRPVVATAERKAVSAHA